MRTHPSTRACSVPGCDRPHFGHGLCSLHYRRVRSTGTTDPPIDRITLFWSRIQKADGDACWPWQGHTGATDHCRFGSGKGRVGAHRYAYELTYGPIPAGMCVCHRCDNPPCCNPAHLFLGTKADNNHDTKAKGRAARGDNHGTHLHPESVPRGAQHHTVLHPERRPRGKANKLAKLTDAAVMTLRQMYARHEATQTELARLFGVRQTTISRIVLRQSWTHVP